MLPKLEEVSAKNQVTPSTKDQPSSDLPSPPQPCENQRAQCNSRSAIAAVKLTFTKRLSKSPKVSNVNDSSGKRADAFSVERPKAVDRDTSAQTTPSVLASLVGDVNECNVHVDGKKCKALLDTGSQVTSISESFFKQHLGGRAIQSAGNFLKVAGATGWEVPSFGYNNVNLKFPSEEFGVKTSHKTLALMWNTTDAFL